LKAAIDASQILEDKERQIREESNKYLEIRNELYKVQRESTKQIWLLKQDVENLERDKKELEERNQSLQIKVEEMT
jgi:hypothetical protein